MFDVKPSLIRFWEQRFDILKPKKNKKGNRLFTPADVKNLETIYHLTKERGMTLAGVEKYLKSNKGEADREAEIVRRLQTIRSLLAEIREELKEDADDEIRVFTAGDPADSDPAGETAGETVGREPTAGMVKSSVEAAMEPGIPDPSEFTEEGVLAGEIAEDELPADDFWDDEQAVEELREEEDPGPVTREEPVLESTAFEGYADETDSFGEQVDDILSFDGSPEAEESAGWEDEEVLDEEVSVPFTAQPLFVLDEPVEAGPEDTGEESQPQEETKPSAVDTQQSLF